MPSLVSVSVGCLRCVEEQSTCDFSVARINRQRQESDPSYITLVYNQFWTKRVALCRGI
ncbi:hypothetical protein TSAR_016757 [Trichomalopsis sarcophagae]|uniref:Uncharacterized protein n=1 Tax=Trichomalopsis sarcophagae TaxID=543379 RepID=A0A232FN07_9HYME|nr:hypothetical protein TSAR_016757 [Trichomalopsis sarcophagae]